MPMCAAGVQTPRPTLTRVPRARRWRARYHCSASAVACDRVAPGSYQFAGACPTRALRRTVGLCFPVARGGPIHLSIDPPMSRYTTENGSVATAIGGGGLPSQPEYTKTSSAAGAIDVIAYVSIRCRLVGYASRPRGRLPDSSC